MSAPVIWRVGRKVLINIYEGDRPVCQCHTVDDARRIVDAMNLEYGRRITDALEFLAWMEQTAPETLRTWQQNWAQEVGHA